jgi:hypothetical protein
MWKAAINACQSVLGPHQGHTTPVVLFHAKLSTPSELANGEGILEAGVKAICHTYSLEIRNAISRNLKGINIQIISSRLTNMWTPREVLRYCHMERLPRIDRVCCREYSMCSMPQRAMDGLLLGNLFLCCGQLSLGQQFAASVALLI